MILDVIGIYRTHKCGFNDNKCRTCVCTKPIALWDGDVNTDIDGYSAYSYRMFIVC